MANVVTLETPTIENLLRSAKSVSSSSAKYSYFLQIPPAILEKVAASEREGGVDIVVRVGRSRRGAAGGRSLSWAERNVVETVQQEESELALDPEWLITGFFCPPGEFVGGANPKRSLRSGGLEGGAHCSGRVWDAIRAMSDAPFVVLAANAPPLLPGTVPLFRSAGVGRRAVFFDTSLGTRR